ncbi:MAG: NifB/NifX family molybdenum-iron cluster-binding protein [Chloroflexi bacterium]|nr:NifB/NifX family molybdenum-iron cluster-binding protein [Chloroflexota bacterium]
MHVMISSNGASLDASVSPVFGRCPYYILVDTDTMAVQMFANPAQEVSGGAGIQSAQFIVEKGAQALITGNVGPNAMEVLSAASICVYRVASGTVAAALEALIQGQLQPLNAATAAADTGKSALPNLATAFGSDKGSARRGGGGYGRGQSIGHQGSGRRGGGGAQASGRR